MSSHALPTYEDMHCYKSQEVGTFNIGIWAHGNFLGSSLSLISMQLVIIIVLTQILIYILRPLKQPRVICEMLAGIMIGPSFLGSNKNFRAIFYPLRGEVVLETMSSFGLMYVIFLIGVKTDLNVVIRSGKKAVIIGLVGMILPFIMVISTALLSTQKLEPDMNKETMFIFAACAFLSMSLFAVHVPILAELNLLNSDLGRIAMSACITNDFAGWAMLTVFILGDASKFGVWMGFVGFMSIVFLVFFVVCIVRPLALWVVEKTPPGKPVEEGYIFIFLLLVLLIGFYSDIIGTNTLQGALILGLVIPDGPPLGSALAEKIETIASGLIMPLYYTVMGLNMNIWEMSWGNLHLIIFLGLLGKVVGVVLTSLFFKIPLRDSVALSLFMNSKGIVEIVAYQFWMANKNIGTNSFTILVCWALLTTGVCTPIAGYLYDPSRRYAVYKRRTIQHLRLDTELRVLTCIQEQSHVPAMLNLLEASHANLQSSICVYLMQLVELVGRSAPVFIPHKIDRLSMGTGATGFESDPIINAFLMHELSHPGVLSIHPFTTISPYASMHDEICRLAVEKRVALVLLHFHRSSDLTGHVRNNNGLRTVNQKVIVSAPCSVGLLIDRQASEATFNVTGEFMHHVVVLFFGGADDREALAYGARMARHPGIGLTVIRFLPSRGIKDDQAERKMDMQMVDEIKAMGSRDPTIRYKEELVGDMENIVQALRCLDDEACDLVMVGIRHSQWNKVMSEGGLSEWSECPELGVVGDFLATSDFESIFSVLIVKQQDQAGLHAAAEYNAPVIHMEDGSTSRHI